MDLFNVKRYTPSQKEKDPEKENKLLEKLQGIIAKKKKILEEEKAKTKPEKPQVHVVEKTSNNDEESHVVEEAAAPIDRDTFRVLGNEKFTEKEKVRSILPLWLRNPIVISNDLSEKNASLEKMDFLSAEMRENLRKMDIERLFPVQEMVIPWILEANSQPPPFRPRDICVSAPTGSGKTIAFALPIIEILRGYVTQKIRALVVLPVRELAAQVYKVFRNLCKGTRLQCILFSPSRTLAEEQEFLVKTINGECHQGVDIIVTTAGRLVEHLSTTAGLCLKDLQFLVIDEADRIMDQIQNEWLYHLENHLHGDVQTRNVPFSLLTLPELSNQPQKLLFSATLSSDPEKLESMNLFHPKLFTSVVPNFTQVPKEHESPEDFIGKYTTPREMVEKICETEVERKPLTLFKLIMENSWKRFLCFTNNNLAAHRLAHVLQTLLGEHLVIKELSANLKKNSRKEILGKFAAGKIHGLVTSDTLARGIDLPNVDVVICYDAPRHIRTYIHRIGRTARAGRAGMAVTLICEDDRGGFEKILSAGGKPQLERLEVAGEDSEDASAKYAAALEELKNFLKKEKKGKSIRLHRDENTGKNIPKLPKGEEKVDPKMGKRKKKKQLVSGEHTNNKKAKMN